MTEPRRIDVNGGDIFLLAPNTMWVTEYESVFALGGKIGAPTKEDQPIYLMTATGRINNTDRTETWSIGMSPDAAFDLLKTLIAQFEHFTGMKDLRTGEPGPKAKGFKDSKKRRKGKH